jgi:hypothetical protein
MARTGLNKKGQAEIMDGLILMLIAATCSVVLLSISSDYGSLPIKIYEETYSQKLAQNTLLSLYHITDQTTGSEYYRKSIMVAVSQELAAGTTDFSLSSDPAGKLIGDVLKKYSDALGRQFLFALTDGSVMLDQSLVSTDPQVTDAASFRERVGNPYCASAALTYPNSGSCVVGGEAGSMCYTIFEICTWLS